MNRSISPDIHSTDEFANIASNDMNVIHSINAGRRQIVSGDWQVFYYLSRFNESLSEEQSLEVNFVSMLKPSQQFLYNSRGLYMDSVEEPKPYSTFGRIGVDYKLEDSSHVRDVLFPNTFDSIKYISPFISQFGSLANTDLVLNYLQSSGDIPNLLSEFFEVSNSEFEKRYGSGKAIFAFTGAKILFKNDIKISTLGELERRSLKPILVSEDKNSKNGRIRRIIEFPFVLSDKDENIVGSFRKILLCSYRV